MSHEDVKDDNLIPTIDKVAASKDLVKEIIELASWNGDSTVSMQTFDDWVEIKAPALQRRYLPDDREEFENVAAEYVLTVPFAMMDQLTAYFSDPFPALRPPPNLKDLVRRLYDEYGF